MAGGNDIYIGAILQDMTQKVAANNTAIEGLSTDMSEMSTQMSTMSQQIAAMAGDIAKVKKYTSLLGSEPPTE